MSTRTQNPRRTTLRGVRGADLPPAWAQKVGASTEDELIVQIIPKSIAGRELDDLMDGASDEWAANGGTRETLKNILDE